MSLVTYISMVGTVLALIAWVTIIGLEKRIKELKRRMEEE